MKSRMLIIALVLCLFATGSALAQAGHVGGCTCGQFTTKPIPWQIDHTDTAYQNAAFAEFARWNTVANLFSPALGDGDAATSNGKNEILFGTVDGFTPDVFGICLISPESAFAGSPAFNQCPRPGGVTCGTIQEADVVINPNFDRGFSPTGPPDFNDNSGPAYYGATALHEIGHALGLHHNFNNLSTMNYFEDFAGQYLAIADATIIRSAYPNQAKTMTDIGIYPFKYDSSKTQYSATTPLSFSPTSIAAGGKITISNVTVENVGTVALSNVKVQFFLSPDTTISGSDVTLTAFDYSSFPATAYDEDPFPNVTIPASAQAGSYYVLARVLMNATTADSNSYNNTTFSPSKLTVTGGSGGGVCTPSTANLCLNGNRFRVTLSAKAPGTGAVGPGVATAFNNEVGYYSVPALTGNPNNIEVFVKVLDGRAINGKWWVFYGGLTDFELTIAVTDVTTGAVKTYFRPGQSLLGGADTSAF